MKCVYVRLQNLVSLFIFREQRVRKQFILCNVTAVILLTLIFKRFNWQHTNQVGFDEQIAEKSCHKRDKNWKDTTNAMFICSRMNRKYFAFNALNLLFLSCLRAKLFCCELEFHILLSRHIYTHFGIQLFSQLLMWSVVHTNFNGFHRKRMIRKYREVTISHSVQMCEREWKSLFYVKDMLDEAWNPITFIKANRNPFEIFQLRGAHTHRYTISRWRWAVFPPFLFLSACIFFHCLPRVYLPRWELYAHFAWENRSSYEMIAVDDTFQLSQF